MKMNRGQAKPRHRANGAAADGADYSEEDTDDVVQRQRKEEIESGFDPNDL